MVDATFQMVIDSLDGLSVAFPYPEDEFQDEDEEDEVDCEQTKVDKVRNFHLQTQYQT